MNSSISRIAIIGPGAIGSLFAALLARSGHDIFLLDHRPRRALQRNSEGIHIEEKDAHWQVAVKSSVNALDFGKADVVFICTKAYDSAIAVKQLPTLTGPDSIVVSLQNGIGNAEIISQYTAGIHTVCATTAMGAFSDKSETIHRTGHGITQTAPFGKTSIDDAHKIAEILNSAGCKTQTADDARTMLWSKLLINAAINPVTAIYGITNGELPLHKEACSIAYQAANETKTVTDALGIKLSYDNPAEALEKICKETANNRSSMLLDIENHRKTEIDAITGIIITEAERLNISVPANKRLFNAVRNLL
jgi:2-dehydropantoate 2-reductase